MGGVTIIEKNIRLGRYARIWGWTWELRHAGLDMGGGQFRPWNGSYDNRREHYARALGLDMEGGHGS